LAGITSHVTPGIVGVKGLVVAANKAFLPAATTLFPVIFTSVTGLIT